MSLAIMLAGEGLAADSTNEGTLISMGAKVRSEVVSPSELFGTQSALKCGRMFLDTTFIGGGGTTRVGELEDIVTVGN